MFTRAKELAKNGHDDQAIAMLNTVVKVYKETPTAGEAQAALDRAEKSLPLFSTGPIVVAEAGKTCSASELATTEGCRRRDAQSAAGDEGAGRARVAGQRR